MLLRILPRAAALLMLCVQPLHASVLPAVSSYEFTAYRMQQYAVQQEKHGRVTWPDILSICTREKFTPVILEFQNIKCSSVEQLSFYAL